MTEQTDSAVYLGMKAVVASKPMKRLLETVRRVARTEAAVLITGESGVGKELVARALHHYSLRASQPWVDVSCATLPENLVESELFGHERGAFSSADAPKPGLFELADKGTIFLDEIGELESRMQVKLLRVLDGGSFYRLGGTRKTCVNVRLVTATNQDLSDMVRLGRFRADLFHRLSQIQIDVPPLRERPADILVLAEHFLREYRPDGRLSPDARTILVGYDWPGNVRELRNALAKAAVMSACGEIGAFDLPEHVRSANGNSFRRLVRAVGPPANGGASPPATDWSIETMERRLIFQVLERTGGHQQKAAELLGISRRTLSRKLKSYTLEEAV